MVEVSLRTFSLVDSGGKLVSTWRIGPEAVSEAVRAFSQLRGLSGLLWSVITPSARERRTSTREHLVRIIMDQKPSAMLRRGLHMSSSSTSTTSSFLIDDILVQRPKVTCSCSFSSERLNVLLQRLRGRKDLKSSFPLLLPIESSRGWKIYANAE